MPSAWIWSLRKKAHKIKFYKPLPELRARIVFDAVNNLRATLDQIDALASSGRRAEAAQEIENGADILSKPMRGLRPAFDGDWQVLALEKHGPQRVCRRRDLALLRMFGVGRSRWQRRRLDSGW